MHSVPSRLVSELTSIAVIALNVWFAPWPIFLCTITLFYISSTFSIKLQGNSSDFSVTPADDFHNKNEETENVTSIIHGTRYWKKLVTYILIHMRREKQEIALKSRFTFCSPSNSASRLGSIVSHRSGQQQLNDEPHVFGIWKQPYRVQDKLRHICPIHLLKTFFRNLFYETVRISDYVAPNDEILIRNFFSLINTTDSRKINFPSPPSTGNGMGEITHRCGRNGTLVGYFST
jgi:hypothetical protein